MNDNEDFFFDSAKWKQQDFEDLLKNPPQPVKFTYTVDQLKAAYDNFTPVENNTPGPNYIEDYYEFHEEPSLGDINKALNAIYEFYSLENKNDLYKVDKLYEIIIDNIQGNQYPKEISTAIDEMRAHIKYLDDMNRLNKYQKEQQRKKEEQERARIQQEQQLREQQRGAASIFAEFFPSAKNKQQMGTPINSNDNEETKKASLVQEEIKQLKERITGYNNQINTLLANIQPYMQRPNIKEQITKAIERNNEIDSSQANSLDDFRTVVEKKQSLLDYLEKADKFIKDHEEKEQEEITQLKEIISSYSNQINALLADIQPYTQIPKIKQQVSIVIDKNNEIDSSQIIDSLNDYRTVAEMKQSLLSYLEKADKFIKDHIKEAQEEISKQQTQEPVQPQTPTQPLSEDDWEKLFPAQPKRNPEQPLPNNFLDEFKDPGYAGIPQKYNSDGTYTIAYITHLATTPLGFNQTIYDQLMEYNEMKRKQNMDSSSGGIKK